MSYTRISLANGETLKACFRFHWLINAMLIGHWLLALVTFGIWLLPALYITLKWLCIEQAVSDCRVIYKEGIISRRTNEIRLNAIESVYLHQSLLGRLFGYGTVTVTGRGHNEVRLIWLQNPVQVKRFVESQLGV
jgi:uncharacterized membrane protein YdbT with pleckstrin-like domain